MCSSDLFELYIIYTLEENKVNINWQVKNVDNKKIYFSIGAHPAFNISSPEDIEDYYLDFICKDNIEQVELKEAYYDEFKSVDKLETMNLTAKSFENDAMIFTNIDEIAIKNKKDDLVVNVLMKDFPVVGIWSSYYKESNSIAPFICIEPWYGIADACAGNKVYKDKKFINELVEDRKSVV